MRFKSVQITGGESGWWSEEVVIPCENGEVVVFVWLKGRGGEGVGERLRREIDRRMKLGKMELSVKLLEAMVGWVGGEWEGVIVRRSGEKIQMVGKGKGLAIMAREGRLGLVWKEEKGLVEGLVKAGDVFLVGSKSLGDKLVSAGLDELKTVGNEVEDLVERWKRRGVKGDGVVGIVVTWQGATEPGGVAWVKKVGVWWRGRGFKIKNRFDVEQVGRRKRVGMVLFVVVMILLIGSVYLGAKKREEKIREELIVGVISPVDELLEQSRREVVSNRAVARELVEKAKQKMEEGVERLAKEGVMDKRVEEKRAEVERVYGEVAGVVIVEGLVWMDLGLVREGMIGGEMSLIGEEKDKRLLVWDKQNNVVVEVEVGSKKSKVVSGGGEIAGASALGSGVEGVMLVESGVVKLKEGGVEMLVKNDPDWSEPDQVGSFGGRVYVLDKKLGDIWRYKPGDGKAERVRWLAGGVVPDFSNVIDMLIDGNIWVLDSTGQLRGYVRGVSSGFYAQEWEEGVWEAVAVASDDEKVYILEKTGARVVVFGRDGSFVEQWRWDELKNASDIVMVEGKMLVLVGGKIYEVGK